MKAQLYKMTLYVCDLEDNLSQYEIENLIRDRALDGIAVNCVCHFADRQIGKQVEWDDDIDINRCDCPSSAWNKYFTPPAKPMTHGDRIRAMTDEELAKVLVKGDMHFCEAAELDCIYGWHTPHCEEHALKWLQQPAEEGEEDG